MKYTYQNILLIKFLKKKKFFIFKNIGKIPKFLLNYTLFLNKGIFFRKIIINKYNIGMPIGNFITSRKPFSRIFSKKRR